MADILNLLLALATIGFGAAGWLAPRWTGLSEVRAASGALFVVAGVGAILIGFPAAYAMLGFVWGGGALGRATSLLLDGRTTRKWGFFGTEIVFAVLLLGINLT